MCVDSGTSILGLGTDSATLPQANCKVTFWDTTISIDPWDVFLTQLQCGVRQVPHTARGHDCGK